MLGDIRAVLYVSETTHLPMRTLVDMPMSIAGQTLTMHIYLVIAGVKQARLDSPGRLVRAAQRPILAAG